MRTKFEIYNIIHNMDKKIFEKINTAEFDTWSLDQKIKRNGYKRLIYNLKKAGLTIKDWNLFLYGSEKGI